MNIHLNSFHFSSGNLTKAMAVDHYCQNVNDDIIQCILYDGNATGSRMVGIEYIISSGVFSSFAPEEKKLWHSHAYEVKSGQAIAPELDEQQSLALAERLVSTYGKTFHTWDTTLNQQAPIGIPELMMAFTADGQLD